MCLQYLIDKYGKDKVIKLLPTLFITIDTDKIDTNNIICENDYFMNPQTTVNTLYKNIFSDNYENTIEIIHNIAPIVELFHEIAIDKAMYDSVVISYLGKKHIRFKNGSDKKFGKTLYLDVQALRIALTDMQTEQTVRRLFANGLKICAGAFMFAFLHKHHYLGGVNFLRIICLRG